MTMPAASTTPLWCRAARLRPLRAVLVVLLAAYGLWQLLRWPAGARPLVGDLFSLPFDALAVAAAWAASRRCAADARRRSAWRILALGLGANLLADSVYVAYEAVATPPFPSLADPLYLTFYPLILAGLLRFPTARRTRGEWLRVWLDLLVVAIGGAAAVGYVFLGPTIAQASPKLLAAAVSVAYPAGDIVLLVGVALVLVRRTDDSSTASLRLFGAGLVVWVIADTVYGYLALHERYVGGDPVDIGWIVATALFALAAAAQPRVERESAPAAAHLRPPAPWAPYLGIAAAFGLLVVSERHDQLGPAMMLAAAVLVVTLVVVRQHLARHDLLRARGELDWRSMHDALTGLPNRVLVTDRAERMLARARRSGGSVAALIVDVDGFHEINDRYGHAAADEVLRAVAARLSAVVRESDTAGRLGSDDFVVLLEDEAPARAPETIAGRVREALAAPIEAGDRLLSISVSVGVAVGWHASADELLRDATAALEESRAAGRERGTVFHTAIEAPSRDRLELEIDLRGALDRGELRLVYQPVVRLADERIVGVEALLRWRHPQRGNVPPDVFVPLAEDCGLIVPIGRWVLRTACEQAAAWAREGLHLQLAVNLSARQLEHADIVGEVATALGQTGVAPQSLTLEITETALMADSDAAARRLAELKALGVRIAIDDFGTGYCSLSYLREFHVDAIKIDRSFVAGIGASEQARALIRTLVQLGTSLGLQTTGEGIEDREQLRHLRAEGCELGQGYLFAKPLAPAALAALALEAQPVCAAA